MAHVKITKDYLPEALINQGTTYPILQQRCHCGKRIGSKQREIEFRIGQKLEELENSELTKCDKQAIARRETFKEMGYTRSCCLTMLTLYPFFPINDYEGMQCIIDCTNVRYDDETKENNYLHTGSKTVPYEIFPVTKGVIGFDMDAYAQKIYETVTGNKPKSGESFPTFPMFNAKRSKYPEINSQYLPPEFN